MANHIILAIVWIIYCGLHSLLASRSIKKDLQNSLKSGYRFYRLFYTLFAFVFLVIVIYYQASIPAIYLFRRNTFSYTGGFLMGISGLLLMLICIKKYFAGLSGLVSLFTEHHSPVLLITGVHRYVRHPLYLGTFAFIWGLFLIIPQLSLLIMDVIITGYTLVGIKLEEDKLLDEFGQDYKAYKKNVPMLIPKI